MKTGTVALASIVSCIEDCCVTPCFGPLPPQVALVDTLSEIGVTADVFVGHSTGELACAYADGGLTAEQTVTCAYWRGRCIEVEDPPKGAMAAVGECRCLHC